MPINDAHSRCPSVQPTTPEKHQHETCLHYKELWIGVITLAVGVTPGNSVTASTLDLVIKNGKIFDGTGTPRHIADIGILDDKSPTGDEYLEITSLRANWR